MYKHNNFNSLKHKNFSQKLFQNLQVINLLVIILRI